jgi:5-methylcytosine-specific restriction endonuclease McrA
MRGKRSAVWLVGKHRFIDIVANSVSKNDILKKLGMRAAGGNYKTLSARLEAEGLLEELKDKTRKYLSECLNKTRIRHTRPIEDILKENSSYDRSKLKSRLIKLGFLDNKCSKCGIRNEWNGSPLTLQIDHINGKYNDNRIENLRLLCPNCHSQTETFVGKATRKAEKNNFGKKRNRCMICNAPAAVGSKSGLCRKCYDMKRRKVQRPEREELKVLVNETGYSAVGRKFGVSDNAIRKWLR